MELLNPFNERELLSDKPSSLDVKARDQRGTTFQIEVQIAAPERNLVQALTNELHGLGSEGQRGQR